MTTQILQPKNALYKTIRQDPHQRKQQRTIKAITDLINNNEPEAAALAVGDLWLTLTQVERKAILATMAGMVG